MCIEHARLWTVCPSCITRGALEYVIDAVTSNNERKKVREFVQRFWGEQEQLTFDRKFMVAELPAYIARFGHDTIAFISFVEIDDAIVIVALGVLPLYQSSGVGASLVEKVEGEARRMRKKTLLVSTSNDDLPALAFYQSFGFQIYEVKPNVIAEKHGEVLKGIGGLPVRDELRLKKILL